MTKLFTLFLIIGQISVSLGFCNACNKRKLLQKRPKPMEGFSPEKMRGRWYTVMRYVPCGFLGFREFTDDIRDADFDLETSQFVIKKTYRSGRTCQTLMDTRAEQQGQQGLLYTQDAIGDLYSGHRIGVYTDYHNFLIQWGCLRYNMEHEYNTVCRDVTMAILSRTKHLRPKIVKIINMLLRRTFGITLSDMEFVSHDNPCHTEEEPEKKEKMHIYDDIYESYSRHK